MIVDLFLGFNELELAEFRINYLDNLIAHVVIGESDLTHSGKQKDLYFKDWVAKLPARQREKVSVISIPLSDFADAWDREIFSREYIANYAKNRFPGHKFILSDLDEIPSRDQVSRITSQHGVFHFTTPTSYRRINWKLTDSHSRWSRGVCGDLRSLNLPNGGRFSKLPNIGGEPGVHLSYLGLSVEQLVTKLSSFAHTEINSENFAAFDFLSFCDFYRIDHLGRVRSQGFGLLKMESPSAQDLKISLAKNLPQYFDLGDSRKPSSLRRLLASSRLSVYLRSYDVVSSEDRLDSFHHYISSPRMYFWGVLELMVSFVYLAKRIGVKVMREKA